MKNCLTCLKNDANISTPFSRVFNEEKNSLKNNENFHFMKFEVYNFYQPLKIYDKNKNEIYNYHNSS